MVEELPEVEEVQEICGFGGCKCSGDLKWLRRCEVIEVENLQDV